MNDYIKKFLLLLFSVLVITGYSQTLNDAKQKYLDGLQLINDEPETALELFEESLKLCNELGEEATELIIEIESQLPTCHYKIAYQYYQDKKIKESIEAFKKTSEIAEKYGDDDIKRKANDYIPKLYYVIGSDLYKNKDFDGALQNYKKSTELDPTYAKAYYGQALAYSKKEDNANALSACEKAIETAVQTNDMKTLEKAEKIAHNICLIEGNEEKEKGNYELAINKLKKAIEYDTKSAQAYALIASCHNQLSNYDEAISAANKALEYEESDNEKKAGIYYEIGLAHKSKGEITEACEAFKNALFGVFVESAKYQIEVVLKCE